MIHHADGSVTKLDIIETYYEDETLEGWVLVNRRAIANETFGEHTEEAEIAFEKFNNDWSRIQEYNECGVSSMLFAKIIVLEEPTPEPAPIPEGLSEYFNDEIPF